jgi:hypothetical protein
MLGITIVGIVIRIITICGASFYNKWMVGIGAVWTVIFIILNIVSDLMVSLTYNINGTTYYSSPVMTIILTLIWGGLILYVSNCCLSLTVLTLLHT